MRSIQYGIVFLGVLMLVYAHHKHSLDSENCGKFVDCMKGRIRKMTAITPAYAHAFQATCLAQHFPGVPHTPSSLPSPSPDIRIFTMLVPQHVKEATIIVGVLFIQMVVLALLMVKLLLDGV